MDISYPEPGVYVVAVSGGVDSAALLDILRRKPELRLVVAHFDHGIRENSDEDRKLVQSLAESFDLPFVFAQGNLGPQASEARARDARYTFLKKVQVASHADAIITAHHQDDLLETAILNMLRGTGRKGLNSLKSRKDVIRPLLKVSKADLIKYAKKQGLNWCEDETNQNTAYLRNYIRHNILSKFNEKDRWSLLETITAMEVTNKDLDTMLDELLETQAKGDKVDRGWFNQLPHDVAKEFMAAWMRAKGVRDFDSKTLERLVIGAKTAKIGKRIEAIKGYKILVNKTNLALVGPER